MKMKFQIALNKFGYLSLLTIVAASPFAINRVYERPTISQNAFLHLSIMSVVMIYFPLWFLFGMKKLKLSRPSFYILLYLLAIVVSSLFSPRPDFCFYEMIFIVPFILFYFCFLSLGLKDRDIVKFLLFLAIMTLPIVIYAVMQNYDVDILGYEKAAMRGKKKIASFFGNPNFLASYLAPLFFLTIGLAFRTRGWMLRLFCVILCLLNLFCLMLSGTRAAWLGIMVASVVCLLLSIKCGMFRAKYIRQIPKFFAVLIVILVLLFLLPSINFPFEIKERISSTYELLNRLFMWQMGKDVFMDHPLFGVGYHRYHVVVNSYAYGFFSQNSHQDIFGYALKKGKLQNYLHNDYFEILVETGIIGLVLFLSILISTIREKARLCMSDQVTKPQKAFNVFLIGAVFVFIIDAFWGFPLQLPCSGILFWTILAVINNRVYV